MLHLITIGADLRDRGTGLKVLEQGIDIATAEGGAIRYAVGPGRVPA